MGAGSAAAIAAVFVWLGMVIAISFIEAPLKFRATGVTLPIGLSIGRLVFRALNGAEAVFAAILLVAVAIGNLPGRVLPAVAVAVAALFIQLAVVRPALTRRSDRVLAGEDAPRSSGHHAYIVLELVKVIALLVAGILLLAQ
jgi:cell division protein FtsW (lipid II flippase)